MISLSALQDGFVAAENCIMITVRSQSVKRLTGVKPTAIVVFLHPVFVTSSSYSTTFSVQ